MISSFTFSITYFRETVFSWVSRFKKFCEIKVLRKLKTRNLSWLYYIYIFGLIGAYTRVKALNFQFNLCPYSSSSDSSCWISSCNTFSAVFKFAINISFIKPRYVYNLVFVRNSETNGVGKQHWWDWGRSWSPYMPPGWWAFITTWQAVWESGTLRKDGAKREYPNLFKGRQPYRPKSHLKLTLRRSLSKS